MEKPLNQETEKAISRRLRKFSKGLKEERVGFAIEAGHTKSELNSVRDDECWDFTLEDFFGGAITPQDGMVYYLIGNRVYETNLSYEVDDHEF